MNTLRMELFTRLHLDADTAAELMMPNPVSIRDTATLKEAVALLTDKGYSAAPVINTGGRPVGVLSRSDILVHERERVEHLAPPPEFYDQQELTRGLHENVENGFRVENVGRTVVKDMMTPAVFSVWLDTPAAKVVSEMLALKVHRLFVVDDNNVLVGVISALDVLRHLRP
jgi:CBS domain-containing protein